MFLSLFLLMHTRLFAQDIFNHEDALRGFSKANTFYTDERFQLAVNEYERVLTSGFKSGELYFNLGNAYYRLGDKGAAVLNYERSKLFIPRDRDLKYNLRFAKKQLGVVEKGFDGNTFLELSQKYSQRYTGHELVLMVLVGAGLLGIMSLVFLYFRVPFLWQIVNFVIVFSFIGLNGYSSLTKVQYDKNAAIVLKRVETMFEPKEDATKHFLLKEGERVWVKQDQGGWVKIENKDSKQGWVNAAMIGLVLN